MISVTANDTDGNLQYVNVDQVSPNAGYYGAGYNTGTENPPGGNAYNIGTAASTFTRNLTLTLNTPGTYVFKGMAADNAGSGWQPSSNTVSVVVSSNTGAPVITRQPQSRTITLGFDVAFGVTANGAAPFSYQWKKNGTNLAGATSALYTISNASAAHAGNYTVAVSNGSGSVTSAIATLTLVDPNADSDGDGIPNLTETAVGSNAASITNDGANAQQQLIHRPTN